MNINSMKKKDYIEKNTILVIVYGTAAILGGLAQFFQDRPVGLALSLIVPSLFSIVFYLLQRKMPKLQTIFPYFVVACGFLNVVGCITSYHVTLSTIVLSFFILVLSSVHNNFGVLISGYFLSMAALVVNVILDTTDFTRDPANIFVTGTLMALAIFLQVRQNKKMLDNIESLMEKGTNRH